MNCINLQEHFGTRYRIAFDPVYDPRSRPKDKLDPWMMLVSCERGVIYSCGGELLAAEVERRARTRKRLRELDCTTVVQESDNFLAVTFNVANFPRIARLVKPRRRRRLTESQKQAAAERLARYQFRPQSRTSDRVNRPETPSKAPA